MYLSFVSRVFFFCKVQMLQVSGFFCATKLKLTTATTARTTATSPSLFWVYKHGGGAESCQKHRWGNPPEVLAAAVRIATPHPHLWRWKATAHDCQPRLLLKSRQQFIKSSAKQVEGSGQWGLQRSRWFCLQGFQLLWGEEASVMVLNLQLWC